jgi:hypothetical protein
MKTYNVTIEGRNVMVKKIETGSTITFTADHIAIIDDFHGESAILVDEDGTAYNIVGNSGSRGFDSLVIDGEYLRKESLPELTEEFILTYDFSFL